jgi:hypothetical protein
MKTTKQFSIMMAVVLLSLSINSCKDQLEEAESKSITITLHVDTDNISQQNEESTCYFTYSVFPVDPPYNFKQVDGVSVENFTTPVRLEDEITWVGVSASSPYTDDVKIKKIKYKQGKKILNEEELLDEARVFGIVKNGIKGDKEKYWIEFTVFNNGIKRNGIFKIDPKLQVIN